MRYAKPGGNVETVEDWDGSKVRVNWGISGRCFCCGEKAEAVWRGLEASVEVCSRCAVEELPKLIADAATVAPARALADFERALETVARVFWRAAAARLASVLKAGK